MKHQALFSSKDKSKNIKVLSAAFWFWALRVKLVQLIPVFYGKYE